MSNELLKSLMAMLFAFSDEDLTKVKEFMETLIKSTPALAPTISTEMVLGNRTYQILSFLNGKERYINGKTMVSRAKEMNANLGQEDCQYILDHWKEIPPALYGNVVFVFSDYRHPASSENVAYVYWRDDHWIQSWRWLDYSWGDDDRVLCRKPAAAGK